MKRITTILLFIGCIFIIHGQENSVLDSVVSNIVKQLLIFPQEKVYLQTDKPYYISGEKLFFRAFLLDAFSNRQDTLSRYVYVELINPADSVIQRVKIRKDSTNMFYGIIPLQEDLPQATYKIRAYTQYMQNQSENSFFTKYVRISDPQILDIQTQSDFQFADGGKINASLRFVDAKTQEVIQPQSVVLRLNQDRQFTGKSDKEGWIRVKLTVPSNAPARVLYVEMNKDRYIFKQYLRIPYPKGDFDVSFYPEGGHLVAGRLSNVTFKALDAGGSSLNIKGEVIDSKGNVVTEFKTVHDGMGEFYIKPLPDEHYQAICHYGNRTLQFDLPEVQKNALALKAMIRGNKLLISINKQDSVSYPSLYLFIHSRGSIVYAKQYDTSKDFIAFDTSIFPSGISHILLLTKDLQIVSERLVFLLNEDNGFATFQTQKGSYRKREQIQADIQLKDEKRQPLKGNFSIAVTNDKEVVTDTTTSILSGILLSSELKGQIDNPEYYFQKGNKEVETAADLLMKTNGWTRYAIPNVIRGKLNYPKIPFEQSQEISGTVKSGLRSSLAKNVQVSLLALNFGFLDLAKTDKNGRYVFRNFEFPDSTKYVIQALNSKGKVNQMAELYIKGDTFPGISASWINPIVPEEKSNPVLLNYVTKADRQYTYEHGIRMINLPEVQVRGIYQKKNKYDLPYIKEPNMYSFSGEDLKRSSSVTSLFYHVPASLLPRNSLSIETNGILPKSPHLSSDPMALLPSESTTMTINNLNMINIKNLQQLSISRIIGEKNFTIMAYYNKGNETPPPDNIKSMMPLGYQLPIEFYSPKYDTQEKIDDSKPDLRTTIYWKPNLLTDDAGDAKLDFYTADDPGTYSVIIEGVSDDGKLIHYRGKASIVVK